MPSGGEAGQQLASLHGWHSVIQAGCEDETVFRQMLEERSVVLGPLEPVIPFVEEFMRASSQSTRLAIRVACGTGVPLRYKSLGSAIKSLVINLDRLMSEPGAGGELDDPVRASETLKLVCVLGARADIRELDNSLFSKVIPFATSRSRFVADAALRALPYLLVPKSTEAIDLVLKYAMEPSTTDSTRAALLELATRFPRDELIDVATSIDIVLDVVQMFPTLASLKATLEVVSQLLPDILSLSGQSNNDKSQSLEITLLLAGWLLRRLEADERRDAQVAVASNLVGVIQLISAILSRHGADEPNKVRLALSEIAIRLIDALALIAVKEPVTPDNPLIDGQPALLQSVSILLESKIVAAGLESLSHIILCLASEPLVQQRESWPLVTKSSLLLCDALLTRLKDARPDTLQRHDFEKERAACLFLTEVFTDPRLAEFGSLILQNETWESRLATDFSSFHLYIVTSMPLDVAETSISGLRRMNGALADVCSGVLLFLDTHLSQQPSAEEELTRRAMNIWLSDIATVAFASDPKASWSLQCSLAWQFLGRFTDSRGCLLQSDKYLVAKVRDLLDAMDPGTRKYDIVGRVLASIAPDGLERSLLGTLSLGLNGLYYAGKNALACPNMRPELARLCFARIRTNWDFRSTAAVRCLHWVTALEKLAEAFQLVSSEPDSLVSVGLIIRVLKSMDEARTYVQLSDTSLKAQVMCISMWEAFLKSTVLLRTVEAEVGVGPGRSRALSFFTNLKAYVDKVSRVIDEGQLYPLKYALSEATEKLRANAPLPSVAMALHRTQLQVPRNFFEHQPRHIQVTLEVQTDRYEDGLPLITFSSFKESRSKATIEIPYTIRVRTRSGKGVKIAKTLRDTEITVQPKRGQGEFDPTPLSAMPVSHEHRCFVEEDKNQFNKHTYGLSLVGHGIVSCGVLVKESQTILVSASVRGERIVLGSPGGSQMVRVKRVTTL